ncbi:MAG: dihydropteroate synthase [Chitinophagaceae bacterium]|nr:dihydropteroate synthase [Chitinophagaceae bacterium]
MEIPASLNCKGRLLQLSGPIVMGILNATPDSFYNQGNDSQASQLLALAGKMLQEGATILDIGGMSTKPGATTLSASEEMDRLLPVIETIRKHFPECTISADTYRCEVADQALMAGADIINDISGAEWEPEILNVAAKYRAPYIAMHIQGRPANMQHDPQYQCVTTEVYDFFSKKIKQCHAAEINDIILDVGFGFGKTVAHNYELLAQLSFFKQLRKPLLAGLSRKSMICKPLKINPVQALNGTTALHMLALQNGADILRVHDVKEAMECIKLFENYREHAHS